MPWISDTLCRLATGGGFAVRQLYSDQDEVLFEATRPLILNGIEDIVTRPDLADRALFLTLAAIPEERRWPEQELWQAFEAERPRILGALLDAAATGLARLPDTRLPKLPRMADFALFATACERAFGPAGAFWRAYNDNRDDAVDSVIDADPVAAALRSFMADRAEWSGTASALLAAIGPVVGERSTRAKGWPESPRALGGRLRRAATFLRKAGINIGHRREGSRRTRIIVVTHVDFAGGRPSVSSAGLDAAAKPGQSALEADASSAANAPTVRVNGRFPAETTKADEADSKDTGDSADLTSLPVHCRGCGEPESSARPLIPYGTAASGVSWLHPGCWKAWRAGTGGAVEEAGPRASHRRSRHKQARSRRSI